MALTKCKECKNEVSTKAEKCPNCGVSKPGVSAKDVAVGIAGIVGIVLFAIAAFAPDDEPEASAEKVPEQTAAEKEADRAAEAEACRQDIQCWGQEHWSTATRVCQREIERQAQYQVKWTDEYPDVKLSRRGWLDEEQGTLTYYGDRVQFSNGYGAFKNYMYRCDYNPESQTVLNLEMEPGRI